MKILFDIREARMIASSNFNFFKISIIYKVIIHVFLSNYESYHIISLYLYFSSPFLFIPQLLIFFSSIAFLVFFFILFINFNYHQTLLLVVLFVIYDGSFSVFNLNFSIFDCFVVLIFFKRIEIHSRIGSDYYFREREKQYSENYSSV